jgi:hypothetical protein
VRKQSQRTLKTDVGWSWPPPHTPLGRPKRSRWPLRGAVQAQSVAELSRRGVGAACVQYDGTIILQAPNTLHSQTSYGQSSTFTSTSLLDLRGSADDMTRARFQARAKTGLGSTRAQSTRLSHNLATSISHVVGALYTTRTCADAHGLDEGRQPNRTWSAPSFWSYSSFPHRPLTPSSHSSQPNTLATRTKLAWAGMGRSSRNSHCT